jgi:hypothetical protein
MSGWKCAQSKYAQNIQKRTHQSEEYDSQTDISKGVTGAKVGTTPVGLLVGSLLGGSSGH